MSDNTITITPHYRHSPVKINDHKGQTLEILDYTFWSNPKDVEITCLEAGKLINRRTLDTNFSEELGKTIHSVLLNVPLAHGNDMAKILGLYTKTNMERTHVPRLTLPVEGVDSAMDIMCRQPIVQKVRKEGALVATK